MSNNEYFVYIVRCSDKTLYTGIAIDVEKRIFQHNNTKNGAKYTERRRPVELVYQEGPYHHSDAAKREHAIKQFPKREKEILVYKYKKEKEEL